MQKMIILPCLLLVLGSCTFWNKTPEAVAPMYPQSQTETPATKFCEAQGGKVLIEKSGSMDMAYCNTKKGEKIDAWKYMSDMTIVTPTGSLPQ